VVEALKVTLTRHMTHGVSGLGRSDSDNGHHPFPWPYLFIQLANLSKPGETAPKHDNKVLLSPSQNEVRGGMFLSVFSQKRSTSCNHIASANAPTDRYFIGNFEIGTVQYDMIPMKKPFRTTGPMIIFIFAPRYLRS
jgi:hypothetical protein